MAKKKTIKKKTGILFNSFFNLLVFVKSVNKFLKLHRRWLLIPAIIILLKFFSPSTFFIISLAGIFYLLFFPAVDWLQTLVKSNNLAVGIFFIIVTSILVFSAAFIIPSLFKQAIDFSKNFPEIQQNIMLKINTIQKEFQILQQSLFYSQDISIDSVISKYLNQWGQTMISFFDRMLHSISDIIARLLQIIVAFVVSLYLLFERKNIVKFFNNFFIKKATKKEKLFLTLSYEQIISYFNGVLLLSIISFFCSWLFLSLLGVKFSLLLAIWTGIMELIPIFGPAIALVPIVIVAWTQSLNLVLYVIIFSLLLQFTISYLFAPHILGKKTPFSPIVIFILILIGGETLGILGMLFAIPTASLLVLFWNVFTNRI